MDYTIEKSGTGIERSGTGIERSGTGIERSGTGGKFKRGGVAFGTALMLASSLSVNAMEPQVLVTHSTDTVLVSVHSNQSILVGSMPVQAGAGEYLSITLYDATSKPAMDTAGSKLMVAGSGGGSPGASCNPEGSELMVAGSGGGSASDGEANCMNKILPWGSAELVFDPAGTSIIVHRNGPNGPEEFMVEFIASSPSTITEYNANSLPAEPHFQIRPVAMH